MRDIVIKTKTHCEVELARLIQEVLIHSFYNVIDGDDLHMLNLILIS